MEILNKREFENNLWVGEVDFSKANSSREARIKAVTDIASICKGRLGFKEPYNTEETMYPVHFVGENVLARQRLYNRLLIESANKNPGTSFEFVPVKIAFNNLYKQYLDIHSNDIRGFYNNIIRYSYVSEPDNVNVNYILTNMRCLLNAGIKEEDIPFNEEVEGFKVIVARTDFKSVVHIDRHRAFVFQEESSRNKRYLNNVEFHYPSWWENKNIYKVARHNDEIKVQSLFGYIGRKEMKPEEATMELSMRRLVHWAFAAWKQDESAWDNLFTVRGDKTGTQNCTKQVVDNIKSIINGI